MDFLAIETGGFGQFGALFEHGDDAGDFVEVEGAGDFVFFLSLGGVGFAVFQPDG